MEMSGNFEVKDKWQPCEIPNCMELMEIHRLKLFNKTGTICYCCL